MDGILIGAIMITVGLLIVVGMLAMIGCGTQSMRDDYWALKRRRAELRRKREKG